MARLAPWLKTAKPPEKPATSVGVQIEGPGTPSQTTLPADRLKEIQAAVEASPSKIAVIFVRDHQVPGPSMHASNIFKFADGSRSWDHVAVAWMDTSGNLVFAEARPINGPTGVVLFGKNSPGTATQLVTEYKDFKVVSIDLGRYGPGARDAFVNAVSAATGPGSNYSLTNKNVGTVCSGAIGNGFEAAREAQKPTPSAVKYLKESYQRLSILGLNFTKWDLYNPKDAYLEVVKHRVDFRFDPNAPLVRREWSVVGAPKMGVVVENELGEPSLVLSSATLESETYDLRIDDARLQPATGQGKQTSHDLRTDDDRLQPATGEGKQTQQALQDPSDDEDDQDDEDALADDSLQDPETDADDDEDAFERCCRKRARD